MLAARIWILDALVIAGVVLKNVGVISDPWTSCTICCIDRPAFSSLASQVFLMCREGDEGRSDMQKPGRR